MLGVLLMIGERMRNFDLFYLIVQSTRQPESPMLAFQEFISAREVLPFVLLLLNYLGHNVFHMIIFLPFLLDPMSTEPH
jgi:hypothetical protein